MAAAVPYLIIAAAAASAYASYESGRQQKAAHDYNAALMENQARQAEDAAKIREENYRKMARRQMAENRMAWLRSGVTMEGTPLLVQMESAREMELEALRIKWGGQLESSALLGRAGLDRLMGTQAYRAGMIGAGTSLLGGAARATSMYATYKAGKE